MKEKSLFRLVDPFTPAEHAAFTTRVMGSLSARRTSWSPLWALAASLVLAIGLIGVVGHYFPQDGTPAAVVTVANPLDLVVGMSPQTILAGDVAFPPVSGKNQMMDVPFQILKTDHQIRLAWEEEKGYQYVVQKCILSAKGRACRTETVVNGGTFQDKSIEESPLVLYTVEAVKS
jgi:hypothetical protein